MQNRIKMALAAAAFATSLGALSSDLPADDSAKKEELVTYDDHIRPIFREHCFTCHNQNDAKSGLALDNYAKVIEGGSSGEVVFEDDLDSSRLWTLVSHQEEPVMPPGQDKIADSKLALLSKWIELGMPENSGSKATKKKKTMNLAITPSVGKPDGPAAMPEGLPRDPVVFTSRPAAVSAIATSPWAPLVAVAGQQQVLLYHTDTGELLGVVPFPEGIAYCLQFSRDGSKLLAGGGRGGHSGCAVLFDVRTGERLVKVGDELDAVLAADVNAELTLIALGGPGRIVRIFSTETGEQLHEIRKHTDWIYSVRFSPDSVLLATADRSNGLFVWEADTAREYLDLRGHTGAITDVAWRDDSNALASASLDGTVRLWEMNDGKQVGRANAHGGGVNAVSFAHDGKVATTGQDRTAKLWDPALKPVKTFPAFAEPGLEVALTHDGKRVVAGDWAGQVKMWEAADAKQVALLPANPPTVAMRIAEKQKQLAAARKTAVQAESELAALEQKIADANSKQLAAVQQAKIVVKSSTDAVAAAKTRQNTSVSQMDAASKTVQVAQKELAAAQKMLDAAKAKLTNAEAGLVNAKQQADQSKQQVPVVQQQLKQAQSTLDKVKADGTKTLQAASKDMPAKKSAVEAATAAVEQLENSLKELEAEKAPQPK